MVNIEDILISAVDKGASDIHIVVGMRPIIRISTELIEIDEGTEIDRATARKMLESMVTENKMKEFDVKQDLDFSTVVKNGWRFRVNAHYERSNICMAFRSIKSKIPNIDELFLPDHIKELSELPRGLVLVTGPTGSGKSTTLAALIDQININHNKRIITFEDPVEYAMTNNKCIITQREIGMDCPNFASGLRHALRQDPDVILVGEMRDLETAGATVTAAETGHLVFSTLHTISAAQTVERIIDIYPGDQQNQIRAMLSNTLQAVISQTLFKRIDGPGMVPCLEILYCTPAVRNCIRENRIFEIPNIIETGRKCGMQTMDNSIIDMCRKGFIDPTEAVMRANNPAKVHQAINNQQAANYQSA